MKLPVQMKTIVTQVLKKQNPDTNFLFKTIFVLGLKSDTGEVAVMGMKPRFLHFFSDDKVVLGKAEFLLTKLLGDAFIYEIHEGTEMPEEDESVNLALHERSRAIHAGDFCNVFEKSTPEETITFLFKSSIYLTVNTYTHPGSPNAYLCDLSIFPTIAKITAPDQQRIALGSPYSAIESTVNKDEYEDLVDIYFDMVVIAYNDKITDFQATETSLELLNVAKQIVLGKTYSDVLEPVQG